MTRSSFGLGKSGFRVGSILSRIRLTPSLATIDPTMPMRKHQGEIHIREPHTWHLMSPVMSGRTKYLACDKLEYKRRDAAAT